jgi:HAD superfamily hydrolase (TIGR01509 family)
MNGILFDFDGLIVDTEYPVYQAWAETYAAHGHELRLEAYTGCVGSDFAAFHPATELERLVGRPLDWPALDERRRARVGELLDGAEPLPGVPALLEEASRCGLRCAVASSSPREWVEPWLDRLGLREAFREVVTLDDVARPKPSPELFQLALRRLGLTPGEAVVLEDSRNGLLAALAARVPCVVVPNRVTAGLDFQGAHGRLGSLAGVRIEDLRRIRGTRAGGS